MKNYYAFEYSLGYSVNSQGRRYGHYRVFSSRGERDAFVDAGNAYLTGAGYREAVKVSDPELRAALREADTLMMGGAGQEAALYEVNIHGAS